MNSTQWYPAVLRAIGIVCILFYVLSLVYARYGVYWTYIFLKYVFYRQIPRRLRGPSRITYFEAILLLLFLAGNVLCVAIGAKNTSVTNRMGTLSVINLMPLALGSHMNFIASRCRIRPQSYERMHRWVGKVAIVEGLIHSVMAAAFKLPASHTPPAVIAAAVLATIYFTSNGLVRRNLYELFVILHLLLVGALFLAVWLHTKSGKVLEAPKVYLLTASCLWLLTRLVRLANLLYRNFRYNKLPPDSRQRRIQSSHCTVMRLPDAFHICVTLAQPWKEPRAGQWWYLTFGPALGPGAIFQSHPFVAAWWYKSADTEDKKPDTGDKRLHTGDKRWDTGNKRLDTEDKRSDTGDKGPDTGEKRSDAGCPDTVVFIGQPKSGFTQDIFLAGNEAELKEMTKNTGTQELNGCVCTTVDESISMRAIVEGPYGEELDLSSYGTVVLVATGVGIAHQIAFARRLLEEHQKWNTKAQKITIFWELEKESS